MKSTVIALIMTLLCTTAQACGNSSDTPGTVQPPAKPGTPSYMNPVIHADAPDPSVIRADDGRFYLYTTGGGYAIYSSANLVDWQYEGKIFSDATRPKLERNGRTPTSGLRKSDTSRGNMWCSTPCGSAMCG